MASSSLLSAARSIQWVIRITGIILIVLGILFWTGRAYGLVNTHMAIGLLLVLALWAQAILAALARTRTGLVITAFVWGLVVVILGMTQQRLLIGEWHWIIRVLHLLIGMGAIRLGEVLVQAIAAGTSTDAVSA
jgi:hypothetical protein